MQTTTDSALADEASRRLTKSAPNLTDDQIETWLAQVDANGGQLVLTFDGSVFAEYPRHAAPAAERDR